MSLGGVRRESHCLNRGCPRRRRAPHAHMTGRKFIVPFGAAMGRSLAYIGALCSVKALAGDFPLKHVPKGPATRGPCIGLLIRGSCNQLALVRLSGALRNTTDQSPAPSHTVQFRSIRKPCDIFTKKELRKKSDKSRKNHCKGFQKSGVTCDIRIERNCTVWP